MDEPLMDMVLVAERVTMLPEYKPRYDDEISDKVADDDSVSAGLSTTMLDDGIDKAIGDDKDVRLRLYR